MRAQSAAVADGVDQCSEAQALQTLLGMRYDNGLGEGKGIGRKGGEDSPCATAADAAAWRSSPSALPTCALTAATAPPPAVSCGAHAPAASRAVGRLLMPLSMSGGACSV